MKQETIATIKEYARSSAITFLAFFALSAYPHIQSFDITAINFDQATIIGIGASAVRLIAKAAWDTFALLFAALYEWARARKN